MAYLLFKLNNVPDDEATDIRELLTAQDIYFYETHAGMWRLGVEAIWLPDNTHAERAVELIGAYQLERSARQQKSYADLLHSGQVPTLWQNFCASPLRFVLLIIAVVFVLGITLVPFIMLMVD
jgi:hypothetical protein